MNDQGGGSGDLGRPVIPKTWVPCFQNNESVTDIVSNPKDLESNWRMTVVLEIQGEIECLRFEILQKKVVNMSVFLACPCLFLSCSFPWCCPQFHSRPEMEND